MSDAKTFGAPRRLVVFGATGQLGAELIERLEASDWPIAELVAVATAESVGEAIDFRGDVIDIVGSGPVLKGHDLVFICTPQTEALEIVREALRAAVPCVDCSGALAAQDAVPMPGLAGGREAQGDAADASLAEVEAPVLVVPSATVLSWAPILAAIEAAGDVRVERVVGTVLASAAAWGRQGVASLSEESIALFNQSEKETTGPAGQAVAFDVIPGGSVDCDRVRSDLVRVFGKDLRADVTSLQVPAFVGEGTSLSLELSAPLDREAFEARLAARDDLVVHSEGIGARGLVAVDADTTAPLGPTLRDAAGMEQVLVGRIEADASLPEGRGWRLFVAIDPLRLTAEHALRVARRRLGLG